MNLFHFLYLRLSALTWHLILVHLHALCPLYYCLVSWVLQQPLYVFFSISSLLRDSVDPCSSTELQLVITTARAGILYTQNDQFRVSVMLWPPSCLCLLWFAYTKQGVLNEPDVTSTCTEACVCVRTHGIIWPRVSEKILNDWLQAKSQRKPQCSSLNMVLCIPEKPPCTRLYCGHMPQKAEHDQNHNFCFALVTLFQWKILDAKLIYISNFKINSCIKKFHFCTIVWISEYF